MPSVRVEAVVVGLIPQLTPVLVSRQLGILVKNIVSNLAHEPVERLTLQTFFHGELKKVDESDKLDLSKRQKWHF